MLSATPSDDTIIPLGQNSLMATIVTYRHRPKCLPWKRRPQPAIAATIVSRKVDGLAKKKGVPGRKSSTPLKGLSNAGFGVHRVAIFSLAVLHTVEPDMVDIMPDWPRASVKSSHLRCIDGRQIDQSVHEAA